MDDLWKISYQIDRRDFWRDYYFTFFYHPGGKYLTWLSAGLIAYGLVHGFLRTHTLAGAALFLLPTKLFDGMLCTSFIIKLLAEIPSAGGTQPYCTTLDPQRFCCIGLQKAYRFPWKKVIAIQQTVEYVLFFTWSGTFTIPKRAFDNSDEALLFYQTAVYYKSRAKSGLTAPASQDGTTWPPAPRPGGTDVPWD